MSTLQSICDLPIEFDTFDNEFHLPKGVQCRARKQVSVRSMSHTLLNEYVTNPKTVYDEYTVNLEEDREIFENNFNYDLIVIPTGLLGIEFIRSDIYYSPITQNSNSMKFSTIVEGVQGKVTVIMQRNTCWNREDPLEELSVEEGTVIEMNPGDKIAIPEGYFYTFVNTTENTIIISRLYKSYSTLNPSKVRKSKGMAYFCIRKNAKQEFVYNPRFRNIPNIRHMCPADNHMPDLGFDMNESLYRLAKLKTEKLIALLS